MEKIIGEKGVGMKVYFTASIAGRKSYESQYRQIVAILQGKNCTVMADHILNHNESQIQLETKEERIAFHKKLTKWIHDADCMVVEGTFPSISVGYEISVALHLHKPVLLLYCDGEAPSLMDNCHADRVVCERYTGDDLKTIIEGFLDYIQGKIDSRFTFYVNSEIMAHLDWVAREKSIPKAVYVRGLIEKDMVRMKK